MTLFLWRFFANNPNERPETNPEQAVLMIVLAATLMLDGLLVVCAFTWPLWTLLAAGVMAGLWRVAGALRADDEREEVTR